MRDNTVILLVGAILLTAIALVAPDQRQYVVGALAGLLAGHLNGQQKQQQVNGEGVAKSLNGPVPVNARGLKRQDISSPLVSC